MQKHAREILKRLENKGYEAHLVGGYVRDLMLGMESVDIDICTNATPLEVSKIFSVAPPVRDCYGTSWIKYKNKVYEVTTYRKEIKYVGNRKPLKIEYINKLEDDVIRRDFTINALCLNSEGVILDPTGQGISDLNDKLIRAIGDPDQKMKNDALRVIRAIRFALNEDFTIEDKTKKALIKHKGNLKNISYARKKWELERIFNHLNVEKGISLIKEFELEKDLGIKLLADIKPIPNAIGMYAQIEFNENYPFTKNEKQAIKEIKELVADGGITTSNLFAKSLYNAIVAANILGISKNIVVMLYNSMPIHELSDLAITGDDIAKEVGEAPGAYIKDIQKLMIKEILGGRLKNHKKPLRAFIKVSYNDIMS